MTIAAALITMTAAGAFAASTQNTAKPYTGRYDCTIDYKTDDKEVVDFGSISRLEFRDKLMAYRNANAHYYCANTGSGEDFYGTIEYLENGKSVRSEKEVTGKKL